MILESKTEPTKTNKINEVETEVEAPKKSKKRLFIILLIILTAAILFGINTWSAKVASVKKVEKEQEEQREKEESQETKDQTQKNITGAAPQNDYEERMLKAAQDYWTAKNGNDGAKIILRNYGCHTGLEAIKDGETIMKLSYDGTNITEINI